MRLWTLHPGYLDPKGLVALWREALLAQAVLLGRTRGYMKHPQLLRFQRHPDPGGAIARYLGEIFEEANRRGYGFTRSKIIATPSHKQIEETTGQLLFEWQHLLKKLQRRAPALYSAHDGLRMPNPHPMFSIVPGEIAEWERRSSGA